jgi:lauroyl/myristoyl acyltransferase
MKTQHRGIIMGSAHQRSAELSFEHVTVINGKHYHMYNTTCNPYKNKYIYETNKRMK